jgi:hypothetical protein
MEDSKNAQKPQKLAFNKVTIKTGVRAGVSAQPTTTVLTTRHHTTTAIYCGSPSTTAIVCGRPPPTTTAPNCGGGAHTTYVTCP